MRTNLSIRPLTLALGIAIAACNSDPTNEGQGNLGMPGNGNLPLCTADPNQSCTLDPTASAVWGTCSPDGTCTCRSGYAVDPTTGKCGLDCSLRRDKCLPPGPSDCLVPPMIVDPLTCACSYSPAPTGTACEDRSQAPDSVCDGQGNCVQPGGSGPEPQ
jgi:hypothetical protein